ncbi:Lrp/AsnC family transcriptional regulator [Nocardia sp. alder85J]|uniref:Lrp/AsnC family transcriptional regulator n=1 Tax=Nocardia sp. alder85J TaxID=2862949 RepID=UPI001CD6972E|nr:Lrp/AsnC family transcriptional regulator [Nocardia sp. alder85J]MCX4098231.1 Lrp/AsnC family transcriptional regulator [Nocardia sp. alder85J]
MRVGCRPDAATALGEWLCACPCVVTVERTSGRRSFQLLVAAADPAALDDFVTAALAQRPGVTEAVVATSLHVFVEGSGWRPQALDAAQRAALTADRHRLPPPSPRRRTGDLELIVALGGDARRSAVELAADTGLSDATVLRRISDMTRSHRLVFRCDVAREAAGWAFSLCFWARLPADELTELGATLAAWPEIRLCSAVADDDSNVLLIAWLRTQQDCIALESRLRQRFPNLHITERQLNLRTLERMGRLLGSRGRAIGLVPFGIWG